MNVAGENGSGEMGKRKTEKGRKKFMLCFIFSQNFQQNQTRNKLVWLCLSEASEVIVGLVYFCDHAFQKMSFLGDNRIEESRSLHMHQRFIILYAKPRINHSHGIASDHSNDGSHTNWILLKDYNKNY